MTIEETAIGNTNLFNRSEFISEEIQSTLPPNYLIRPLDRNDDQHGFIELLSQLSVVGDFTPELFKSTVWFLWHLLYILIIYSIIYTKNALI
jgi:hypothetical protein